MSECVPEGYVPIEIGEETTRVVRYAEVVDAYSRMLLTLEEARVVCRRIFGIGQEGDEA